MPSARSTWMPRSRLARLCPLPRRLCKRPHIEERHQQAHPQPVSPSAMNARRGETTTAGRRATDRGVPVHVRAQQAKPESLPTIGRPLVGCTFRCGCRWRNQVAVPVLPSHAPQQELSPASPEGRVALRTGARGEGPIVASCLAHGSWLMAHGSWLKPVQRPVVDGLGIGIATQILVVKEYGIPGRYQVDVRDPAFVRPADPSSGRARPSAARADPVAAGSAFDGKSRARSRQLVSRTPYSKWLDCICGR